MEIGNRQMIWFLREFIPNCYTYESDLILSHSRPMFNILSIISRTQFHWPITHHWQMEDCTVQQQSRNRWSWLQLTEFARDRILKCRYGCIVQVDGAAHFMANSKGSQDLESTAVVGGWMHICVRPDVSWLIAVVAWLPASTQYCHSNQHKNARFRGCLL